MGKSAFALWLPQVVPSLAADTPPPRPVTVADAIEMTRPGEPESYEKKGDAGHFSPDGRHFVIVIRKGDIRSNTNEYRMLLWRTSDALRGQQPETIATMASSSNSPAISDIRWLSDNESLLFAGEQAGHPRQVYKLNIRTRALIDLSHSETNVDAWTADAEGHRIAYLADDPAPRELWGRAQRTRGHRSTGPTGVFARRRSSG